MHFGRPDHKHGYDPLGWRKPIDRQTKAGKMFKQDSDYRKNMVKSRYKLSGKSATESVAEGGMPASVIKQKETLAAMSDEEFAKKYGSKSDEELMSMAWRHGHGKGSRVYVNKCSKGKKGVAEGTIGEYGMMSGTSMSSPHTPASISMTADSGEELSSMLRDIMTLAGRSTGQGTNALGTDPVAATVVDVEPAGDGMGPPEMDSTSSMRAVIDKMNGDDEEMREWDNEPAPETAGVPPGNQDPAGTPGAAKGRGMANHPVATPQGESTFESLMAEYKKFVAEGSVLKSIKRGIAGWGAFDKDKPIDVVKRNKEYDTDTLKRLSNRGSTGKGSPAELQQKVIDRELKKRGDQGMAEDDKKETTIKGMDSLSFWKKEAQKAGRAQNIDWYAIGVEHGKQGISMNPPYGVGARAVTLYGKYTR
jgi:hypothetical protein